MTFELPDLPYPHDALEPHMSARTLRFHHGKHHQGYVDKLNAAVADSPFADLTLAEIVLKTVDEPAHLETFNNAAQVWNHSFFWHCMVPDSGSPSGALAERIDQDFGGLDDFKAAFKAAAVGRFGSGWAWLVLDRDGLRVMSTANAVTPLVFGHRPLLTCDVWEHAYYLDYQNDRGGFVDSFLNHLVNWDFVAERFEEQEEVPEPAQQRSTTPS